jgi:hypothetical protein
MSSSVDRRVLLLEWFIGRLTTIAVLLVGIAVITVNGYLLTINAVHARSLHRQLAHAAGEYDELAARLPVYGIGLFVGILCVGVGLLRRRREKRESMS